MLVTLHEVGAIDDLVGIKDANIGIFVDEEGKEIVYEAGGEEFIASYIDYDLGKVIEKNV